jgi:hypothetical protein
VRARPEPIQSTLLFLLAATLIACKTPPEQRVAPAESSSVLVAPPSPTPAPTREPVPEPPPSSLPIPAPPIVLVDGGAEAGAPACRALRGPIELPLRTPAALALHGDVLDVVLNDDGRPLTVPFPAGPVPPASVGVREPADRGTAAGYAVACAPAGERVFCPDRTGAVRRAARDGSGDRIVASSRTGSRIGAAALAGAHTALAYLASRQTSEGWVSEAWLAVDDEAPVRLSEDGSGATFVSLVPRAPGVLALSLDARAALTAMHVRPVAFEGKATMGEDIVVFVGGPGERRMTASLALPAAGPAWALVPLARDALTFGVAAVRVDEPARVDEPVVWSTYPNGLDPAPIVAVVAGGRTWVARVRPTAPEPGAPRVIELGVLGADGSFAATGALPATGKPSDLQMVVDSAGTQWVAWMEGGSSWLERVACRVPGP